MTNPTRRRKPPSGRRLATLLPLALALVLACRTAPTAGHGDVAFRLLWQGESDLDLHVIDPAGERLDFGHRKSASGGRLDVDCNAGTGRLCAQPIENVYWPTGTAPAGRYLVWVEAHAVIPTEAPVALSLVVLEGERVAARSDGALAANDEMLGPFAVDFPAGGGGGLRLVAIDPEELTREPWQTFGCRDGFRFRVRSSLQHTLLDVGGEPVRLERVPGGHILRGEGFILWTVDGDEVALTTPEGEHGGCRTEPRP